MKYLANQTNPLGNFPLTTTEIVMKKRKVISIESILDGLDSNELKALRKAFNAECSSAMLKISKAEQMEMEIFINQLHLTRRHFNEDLDVVSLIRHSLTYDQRQVLNRINEMIKTAFDELAKLKSDVATDAQAKGLPNSAFFKTSVKRMNKFKRLNSYRF